MFRVKSKKNSPYCRPQALRIWIVLWWKHFRFCRKYLMIIPDDSLILAYKQGFVAAYFLVPRPQIRLGNPCGGGQHTSVCSVMTQPLPASSSATSKQQRGWNKGVLRAGQFASKADPPHHSQVPVCISARPGDLREAEHWKSQKILYFFTVLSVASFADFCGSLKLNIPIYEEPRWISTYVNCWVLWCHVMK